MSFKYEYSKILSAVEYWPATVATIKDLAESYSYTEADMSILSCGAQIQYDFYDKSASPEKFAASLTIDPIITYITERKPYVVSVDLTQTQLGSREVPSDFRKNFSLGTPVVEDNDFWKKLYKIDDDTDRWVLFELDVGRNTYEDINQYGELRIDIEDYGKVLDETYPLYLSNWIVADRNLSVANFSNRIKLYENVISSTINNSEYIDKVFNCIPGNKLCCTTRPTQINYHDGLVELTGNHGTDSSESKPWTTQRYEFIRSLFMDTCAKIVTNTYKNSVNIINSPDISSHFDNFSAFDVVHDTTMHTALQQKPMKIRHVLMQLNKFLEQIRDIYNIQSNFQIYNTKVNTFVELRLKNMAVEDLRDSETGLARRMTKAMCGPYTVSLSTDINKIGLGNSLTSLINEDMDVELSTMVKLDNKIPDVEQKFFNNKDYSNGIESYNTKVIYGSKNHELTLDEVIKQFRLEKGSIISRQNILKAIDYIFYNWVQSVKLVNFRADICHANCHYNSNIIKEYDSVAECCVCRKCSTTRNNSYITYLSETGPVVVKNE